MLATHLPAAPEMNRLKYVVLSLEGVVPDQAHLTNFVYCCSREDRSARTNQINTDKEGKE
jgi:hypothetical protein